MEDRRNVRSDFYPDLVRYNADRCFSKTMQNLPESQLYYEFFTETNLNYLVKVVEERYGIDMNDSYRHDLIDTMIRCFNYHPKTLRALNGLVLMEIRPKIQNLRTEQMRYRQNVVDNQTTRFIKVMDLPKSVCKRKETLSFTEALFGTDERNVDAFRLFQTG